MWVRTAAVVAGSIAGLVVVAAWARRLYPARRVSVAAASVGMSLAVGLALAAWVLVSLGDQTVSFARAKQTEVGRLPQPLPEPLVVAARNELRPGETWTLYTPSGRCREDALRYYWIAFRLLPNAAECDATPSVILAYRIDDLVGSLGTVTARGERWAVIRP